jgi:hypothetical protein
MRFFFILCLEIILCSLTSGEIILYAQSNLPPTGCRTSTLKNTLAFAQSRTGNPGDRNVVIGAFTIRDDDVEDTGVNDSANCNPPGPFDGFPTRISSVIVTLANGDLLAADIQALRLYLDENGDGFFQERNDTRIGEVLAGSCLKEKCVFAAGANEMLFLVNSLTSRSILITADIGTNARAASGLMIQTTAVASDIVHGRFTDPSSDFNENYRVQISNIALNATGGIGPVFINNGSGKPETGYHGLSFTGLTTRFGNKEIQPGTPEAIAVILYVCEGSIANTEQITINPTFASVQGYPDALVCVPSHDPDRYGTRLLRLRVGINASDALPNSVGTLRLYDDANDNGILFEEGELVGSVSLVNGVAVFGALNSALLASTRRNAFPAAGMYSPQTILATPCDSDARHPQSNGTSRGCPHLLALTFDVNSDTPRTELVFDAVLDVGNLPGETEDSPTASSNLISYRPLRSRVQIVLPTPAKSIFQLIAQHTGEPDLIEDEDILWALSHWVKNEPIEPEIKLSDQTVLEAIRLWAEGRKILPNSVRAKTHR